MSDAVPAPPADPDPVPGASPPPPGPPGSEPPSGPPKPRKRFLVIGIAAAAALGVGLFSSLGSSSSSGAPSRGDPVPTISASNVGPSGPKTVSVSASSTGGRPTVLLFFGNWCASCHTELPPLAAAVRAQHKAGGALSHIRVIGVDSLDSRAGAKAFIHSAGVTFPVAFDPETHITNDLFYFTGDPYAVFVNADGTIAKIVRGSSLDPPGLTAEERALIPSGT